MSSLDYEVKLLSRMVAINTDSVTKEGYSECAALIAEEAEQNALDAEVIDGESAAKDGLPRPNVVVTLDAGSDTTLILESHFDIVPPGPGWAHQPFKLTVEGGKAYGRGASDNKSAVVAALGAMRLLKREKLDVNLKLLAGVDEEIGGQCGADYVLSVHGLKGDVGLVLDSGPESLSLGASGIVWGKVTVRGKQGHAGYPFKAKNAIEEAIRLVDALKPYRRLVEKKQSILHAPNDAPRKFVWGRFSVTMMRAGEKENIIPGTCEFRFDRRLLPEEPVEEAERELRGFFDEAVEKSGVDAELEVIHSQPGYYTPKELKFVKTVSGCIEKITGRRVGYAGELGGNDGSFFANNHIPVICYGPLRADTNYHGVDEFVYLEDLKNTRDIVVELGKKSREQII